MVKGHPSLKGDKYNVKVEWETGEVKSESQSFESIGRFYHGLCTFGELVKRSLSKCPIDYFA